MRTLCTIAVACTCCLTSAGPVRAADKTIQLSVSAGEHDRVNTPVCVPVDAPAEATSVTLTDVGGNPIPAQLTTPGLLGAGTRGKSELHFILPSLERGESLRMEAAFSTDPPRKGFAWKHVPDEYAELSCGDRPVLRYMCLKLTDDTREDAVKVYHHVYNPAGSRLITKGPGGKYTHHRGLFFGYCSVTYGEGQRANTWSGRNTPETHAGFLAEEAGPVLGRHLVAVDWQGADNEPYLKEQRELTVYKLPGGTLIEFASQLATTGGRVKLDGNAPHAGFHFRADQEVAEGTEKLTCYLRPDGPGEPGQARARDFDLPWDAISFVLDESRYTVLYLDRPDNPKPAEYNERTYGRFGSFFRYELDEGKELAVSYRIWVQNGEMTVDEATRLHFDFIEPPSVTIK